MMEQAHEIKEECQEKELRARNRELLTLHRVSEIILNARSLAHAYNEIIEEISSATGFPIVGIELYDEARQTMRFKGLKGISLPPDEEAFEVPVGETLSGIVARTGKSMIETNAWDRSEYANEILRRLSVRTFVCVPMIINQEVIGVLSLGHPDAIPIDDRFLKLAESTANYIASLTERKRAEETLRESEGRYRALFEAANDAIFLHHLNPDGTLGRFVAVNDVACTRLGYSREELLHLTVADINAPDAATEVQAILDRLQARERGTFEATHLTKYGRLIPVEISTRLLDLNGQRVVLSIARDITERKEAEQFREEYVSLISHDLRAPLTVILGHADLLRRALAKMGNQLLAERAEAIRTGGKRMNAMIQDMAESVRLEARQMEFQKEPCDLPDLVGQVVGQAILPDDQQRVNLHLPRHPLPVLVDRERFQRVVVNLLTNALKYSGPDGLVKVQVETKEDCAVLAVTDQGPGIDPEDLPHIFERFYRARTVQKAEGLGLGLYICRLIVEALGGRIWVASELEKGCTFYVSLPLIMN